MVVYIQLGVRERNKKYPYVNARQSAILLYFWVVLLPKETNHRHTHINSSKDEDDDDNLW